MKYHLQGVQTGDLHPQKYGKGISLFVYVGFLIGSDFFFFNIYFTVINHGDFSSDKTEPLNCKLASYLL